MSKNTAETVPFTYSGFEATFANGKTYAGTEIRPSNPEVLPTVRTYGSERIIYPRLGQPIYRPLREQSFFSLNYPDRRPLDFDGELIGVNEVYSIKPDHSIIGYRIDSNINGVDYATTVFEDSHHHEPFVPPAKQKSVINISK